MENLVEYLSCESFELYFSSRLNEIEKDFNLDLSKW